MLVELNNIPAQTKDSTTLPWIEKYRPKKLNQIISQDSSISTIQKFIHDKSLPHILLYGPPGTGKTSTIISCATELYGDKYVFMVMELNASDDRGIEVVRTKIKQFVMARNVYCKDKTLFKLIILDEIDAMTFDAQANLRQIIEKYTHITRFCLICNYIQKICPALQSRCQKFRFLPLNKLEIAKKVKQIAKLEKIKLTTQTINTIISKSDGDMRKVLNTLQYISLTGCKITLNYPTKQNINKFIDLCTGTKNPYGTSYEYGKEMINSGIMLSDIVMEIYNVIIGRIMDGEGDEKDVRVISKLRKIEFLNTTIQLGYLIGILKTIY